jgi:hypothetical protein
MVHTPSHKLAVDGKQRALMLCDPEDDPLERDKRARDPAARSLVEKRPCRLRYRLQRYVG